MAKEKKYFWLKQKIDFFQDVRIKKLRKIAGGDTYVIIFQKIMLLSVPTDGVIIFDGVEENLADELALILDEDETNVQVTLDFMHRYKMIQDQKDNTFVVNSVLELIGSESASAKRVRDHREKTKVLQCNNDVTECNDAVTTCNTEKSREELEIETKKSKNIATSESYEDSLRLANFLFNHILKINPTFKQPNINNWAKDIDLAIRIDKRTVAELKNCISWIYSKDGEFWQKNILSGKKLRDKFDTMNIQAITKKPTKEETKLSEMATSMVNVMRKRGHSEEEIEEELRKMK